MPRNFGVTFELRSWNKSAFARKGRETGSGRLPNPNDSCPTTFVDKGARASQETQTSARETRLTLVSMFWDSLLL